MHIQVNGESRDVEDNSSLQDLIATLDLKAERLAIELNDSVVRRAEWEITILRPYDKIEIVHFVGGGSGQEAEGSRQQAIAGI